VERTTGVKVKERVPDYVLGLADQLVNVDLSARTCASGSGPGRSNRRNASSGHWPTSSSTRT
jgi:hypothetical protein